MKRQIGPCNLFFPTPAALVVCGEEPNWNIITIAWIGMVDNEKIGIGLLKEQYSLKLIRSNPRFTVNIPSSNLFRETDYCGLVSGKEVDKFRKTGLTPVPTEKTGVPVIKECPLNIECNLHQEIELDDLVLIIGEFVETHVDVDKSSLKEGKLAIDCEKMLPLVYFALADEYWSVGKKLGNGFESGYEIDQKHSD